MKTVQVLADEAEIVIQEASLWMSRDGDDALIGQTAREAHAALLKVENGMQRMFAPLRVLMNSNLGKGQ